MQTTRCVYDDQIVAVVLSMFKTLLDYLSRVDLSHLEHRHISLFSNDLQLVDSRRSVNVCRYQQRSVALTLEHLRQLCRMGGLTRTLQAAHHYYARRFAREIYL